MLNSENRYFPPVLEVADVVIFESEEEHKELVQAGCGEEVPEVVIVKYQHSAALVKIPGLGWRSSRGL